MRSQYFCISTDIMKLAFLNRILSAIILASCAVGMLRAESALDFAYRRLRFDQMYPPEMAKYIRSRLDASDKPIEVLSELARDDRAEVRVLVAMLLGEVGDAKGGGSLWKLATDDSETVRIAAAGALQRLRTTTEVGLSLEGLKDSRPEVRRLIAATLGQMRDRSAEEALIGTLSDTDEMVRLEAVRALGSCGTLQRSAPALITKLKDSSVLVRTWAAGSLKSFPDPSVIDALKGAMKDADWHVRARAALTLGGMLAIDSPGRGAQSGVFTEALRADEFALVRDRNADALALVGDEHAVEALVNSVIKDEQQVRFHAARAIINAKLVAALPLLRTSRSHPNPEVRAKVVEIIGALGEGDDVSAVADSLTDPASTVRIAAIEALRHLRQRAKPEVLFPNLTDTDSHVRATAARVLGDFGDPSVSGRLLPLLRDENGFVRNAAAVSLGKLGDRSAIDPLIQILTAGTSGIGTGVTDGVVIGPSREKFLFELERQTVTERKGGAIKALGVLKASEAVEPIVQNGLNSGDLILKALSAYALGQIGDKRAVVPLEQAVQPFYETAPKLVDTEVIISTGTNAVSDTARQDIEKQVRVRASVAWALGQIGDPKARETLLKAADDPNSLVRDAAQEALAKIAEREVRFTPSLQPDITPTNSSPISSK